MMVVFGLLAPSSASATINQVFGSVTCTTHSGQRWCGNSPGTTVESWDGTPIDVAVGFPPQQSSFDGNYPVVGIYHGWTKSKIIPESSTAQRWLTKGYAVFSITDRGWGESCGGHSEPRNTNKPPPCEHGYIHLMARAYEVRDVQTLLGKLADEGVISPQRIGATGISYGGGMSLQLGALNDRVEKPNHELVPWESPLLHLPMKIAATAPEYTWTDLLQMLQPNGSGLDYVADAPYRGMLGDHRFGIEKQNWMAETLYPAGEQSGYYGPESDPEANLTGWHNFNIKGGPYDGKPLAIQQEQQLPYHSPYYLPLSEPPAPSLMENGWNDDLVPVDEMVRYYNKVRATFPNEAMKLFFLDLGHNPRSAVETSSGDVGKFESAQNAWFAYYLKEEGSEPAEAHGGVRAITSFCPQTSGGSGQEFKASNWATLAPGEIRLNSPIQQAIAAPGTAPTTPFTAPGTTICTTQAAGDNTSAATYKLGAAPASGFTVMGSPTVIGEFSTPMPNDQVIARLYDVNVPEGGTQQLIGRQTYRPLSPGGGFTKQVFQLHPQAWKVASGHVVKLELLVQDSTYARNSSSSSPHQVNVKNLELRLPTADAPGSAEGLVQAPLPKYLPLGYTLARNVTPSVPGSPHISSGGNPNTGVFGLAWEPSQPAVALAYTLQHKTAMGAWSTVASGLTSPEYAFTSGSKEEEGVWTYRVIATNEGPESEPSTASEEIKVDRSPPVVVTEPASSITQTSATLNATVNPKDQSVSDCKFEYGPTASYGSSVSCSSSPGSGENPVAVSASIGGLTSNSEYHYRISATNSQGTSESADQSFKTLRNPPSVETKSASAVTHTLAILNASVNPNGASVSDCHFEYGTSEAYGSIVPCTPAPGSGEGPVTVYASVGGLVPNTTYHFRISATNAGGTSEGSDQSFTTIAAPPTPHWYSNGSELPLGEKVGTIGWGTLTLQSSAGNTTCHSAQAANVENSAGAARQETVLLVTWECKAIGGKCAGSEARLSARGLPWIATVLEEGEEGLELYRQEASGIELASECYAGGKLSESLTFKSGPVLGETGTWTPRVLNGTTPTKPSEIAFDRSSGHLNAESEGKVISGTPKGQLKFVGYLDHSTVPLIALEKP